MTFNSLEVRTDEAMLELNGATAEPDGATVKFSGDLPSVLLQGAAGSLELEGRYSSHASHPLLELQSQANGLRWNGLSIDSLAISTPKTDVPGRHTGTAAGRFRQWPGTICLSMTFPCLLVLSVSVMN